MIRVPDEAAVRAGGIVTTALADILREASKHGEKLPHHVPAYAARVTAERVANRLRELFRTCWRDGYARGRDER